MESELTILLETQAGRPPEWIQLLPLGEVVLGDGREPLFVDQEALAGLVQHFHDRGLDLVIDYEHQTLSGGKAPAAGWIKELEARADGLWARVEWTEEARRLLSAREYRYFSPVLRLEPESRRPAALLHAALTNTPAINHLAPLVAKDRGQHPAASGEQSSKGVEKPLLHPHPDPLPHWGRGEKADQCALRTSHRLEACATVITFQDSEAAGGAGEINKEERLEELLERLKTSLGLRAETAVEEVLTLAVEKLNIIPDFKQVANLLGLPDDASMAQIKGAVLALKSGLEQLRQWQDEFAAMKTDLSEKEAQEAVQSALEAGKIQPSQKESALKYARSDLEGFKTFVEKSLPVVPLARLKLPQEDIGSEAGRPASLGLSVCEAMGLAPEAFKAQERRLRADGLL